MHAIDSFVGNHQHANSLSHRACPVCGRTAHSDVLQLSDFQFFTDSATVPKRVNLQQVQCRHCLTLFQNPCFTEQGFAQLFAEAGMSYGSTTLRPVEQSEWLNVRQLLQPGTVLLDVGCYEGHFLSQLPDHLVLQGVDIDAQAIARGRARQPSLELVHSAFDRFALSRPPQVITMFHVLEHLPDPVAVLRRLREVSSDDARLVVEVPVLEWGGTNDINGFFSVQHITHFSRQTLVNALALGGWQLQEACKIEGYNGYRVLATKADQPCAAGSIEAGHTGDVAALHEVLRRWYEAQQAVESKLTTLDGQQQIVVWGAGLHTEFLYQCTNLFRTAQRRFVLVDSDTLKQGRSWRGIAIHAPGTLADVDWSQTHMVISSYGGQPAIAQAARQLGVPAQRILALYDEVNVY
jgi:SAM-dependent methyltransferase